jgi:FKBP-type peptidyl-prolyl cis-trans isomerase FklB
MNSPCDCHYRGALIDGREFDSSYARGAPATFAPSEVIKGWCEALLLMKEGDVWQLYVPSELAYGDCSRSHLWRGACVAPLTV